MAEAFAIAINELEQVMTGKAWHADDAIGDALALGNFDTAFERAECNTWITRVMLLWIVVQDRNRLKADAGILEKALMDIFAGDAIAKDGD